jgi:predicted RNA-binding protein YlxR (DUF448 family)
VGQRREPVRTCVGCREVGGKAELIRVVRGQDGVVRVDRTGRAPGRGAYMHPRADCLGRAAKGSLARALRATLGPGEAGRLLDELTEEAGATTT